MPTIKAISALKPSFLHVATGNAICHRRLDREIDYSEVSHDPGPSRGGEGTSAAWLSQPSSSSTGPTVGHER